VQRERSTTFASSIDGAAPATIHRRCWVVVESRSWREEPVDTRSRDSAALRWRSPAARRTVDGGCAGGGERAGAVHGRLGSCLTVDVPLDRTGVVPGTVSCTWRSSRRARPGRDVPDRGRPVRVGALVRPRLASSVALYHGMLPGYTLIATTPRTWTPPLNCPELQAASRRPPRTSSIDLPTEIRAQRDFYSTPTMRDLDAVRQALGFDRSSLRPVGTKLARPTAGFPTTSSAFCSTRSCARAPRPVSDQRARAMSHTLSASARAAIAAPREGLRRRRRPSRTRWR